MVLSLLLRPGAPLILEQVKTNLELWKSSHFLGLPNELINEVASYLDDSQDVFNLRLSSMRFSAVQQPWFFCMLKKHRNIYSRYASMAHFLGMLRGFAEYGLGKEISSLSLVSEGLRFNEYGYEWAWEQMASEDDVIITRTDEDVMDKINIDHYAEVNNNGAFLTGGGFRSMLIAILAACPNLKVINVRKIKPDEHIPGWIDTGIFKKLSFYRPGLHFKNIFYGDWQYDTTHFRVTQYIDEFGDTVSEPNAGPQAGFKEDVEAAVGTSVKGIKINYTD